MSNLVGTRGDRIVIDDPHALDELAIEQIKAMMRRQRDRMSLAILTQGAYISETNITREGELISFSDNGITSLKLDELHEIERRKQPIDRIAELDDVPKNRAARREAAAHARRNRKRRHA